MFSHDSSKEWGSHQHYCANPQWISRDGAYRSCSGGCWQFDKNMCNRVGAPQYSSQLSCTWSNLVIGHANSLSWRSVAICSNQSTHPAPWNGGRSIKCGVISCIKSHVRIHNGTDLVRGWRTVFIKQGNGNVSLVFFFFFLIFAGNNAKFSQPFFSPHQPWALSKL